MNKLFIFGIVFLFLFSISYAEKSLEGTLVTTPTETFKSAIFSSVETRTNVIDSYFPTLIDNGNDLTHGWATFEYCLDGNKEDVQLSFERTYGSDVAIAYGYYKDVAREETYNGDCAKYETVEHICDFKNASTEKNCTNTKEEVCLNYEKLKRTVYDSTYFEGLPSKEKGCYNITITGTFKPQSYVDWIPTLRVKDTWYSLWDVKYSQEKWAVWNSSWAYKKIINTSSAVATNLLNYPYYVKIDTQTLISAGKMQSDCDDLRIVNIAENGVIPYELVSGCNTTSTQVWFLHPNLTANNLSYVYLYYGNPTASNGQNLSGLWANYVLVMHMDDNLASTNVLDSSITSNGTLIGGNTQASSINGVYGKSFNMSAVYYVNLSQAFAPYFNSTFARNWTIQGWMIMNSNDWSVSPNTDSGIWWFGKNDWSDFLGNYYQRGGDHLIITYDTSNQECYYDNGNTNDPNWFMMVNSGDSLNGVYNYYFNSTLTNTQTGMGIWNLNPIQNMWLGKVMGQPAWGGYMDETRIAKSMLSADTIKMDYMQGTGVYYSFGTEQVNAVAPNTPILNTPASGSTGNPLTVTLNITVSDNAHSLLNVTFVGNGTVLCTNLSISNNSVVTCPYSGLSAGKLYTWYVSVQNNESAITNSSTWNFTTDYAPSINLNSPASGSTNNPLTTTLNITVLDNESATTNVTFYKQSDNSVICATSSATNNTPKTCNWAGLTQGTNYKWYVNVTDGILTTMSSTYNFTTNFAPTVTINSPANNSVNVQLNTTLNITLLHADNSTVNVTFYNATETLCTNNSVANNTILTCNWNGLNNGTKYTWYVNVTDIGIVTTNTSVFTTDYPPVITINYPINNAVNVSLNAKFNVTITDVDNTVFNVTYYDINKSTVMCQNKSVSNNTLVSCPYTLDDNGYTYAWNVSATDGYLTTSSGQLLFTTIPALPPVPTNVTSPTNTTYLRNNQFIWINYTDATGGALMSYYVLTVHNTTVPQFMCYQESANTSNQTGLDGNCGLSYTGQYSCVGNWSTSCGLLFDGDRSTYATPSMNNSANAFLYVNYTKPMWASSPSMWVVTSIFGGTQNITVPDTCFNQNKLQFKIYEILDGGFHEYGEGYCWNGISWEDIYSIPASSTPFTEEAMYWNVSNVPIFSYNNSLNLTYLWNVSLVPTGSYYINVTAVDKYSQATSGISSVFTLIDLNNNSFTNCTYNLTGNVNNASFTNCNLFITGNNVNITNSTFSNCSVYEMSNAFTTGWSGNTISSTYIGSQNILQDKSFTNLSAVYAHTSNTYWANFTAGSPSNIKFGYVQVGNTTNNNSYSMIPMSLSNYYTFNPMVTTSMNLTYYYNWSDSYNTYSVQFTPLVVTAIAVYPTSAQGGDVLSFSFFDEQTLASIPTTDSGITITLHYPDGTDGVYFNNLTGAGSLYIAPSGTNLLYDIYVSYGATGYNTRSYSQSNVLQGNLSYTLYLLNTSNANGFLFRLINERSYPLANYTIVMKKLFPISNTIVAMETGVTSSTGEYQFSADYNNVFYMFVIYNQNGTLVDSLVPMKLPTIYKDGYVTYMYSLKQYDSGSIPTYEDVAYSINYNQTNGRMTVTLASPTYAPYNIITYQKTPIGVMMVNNGTLGNFSGAGTYIVNTPDNNATYIVDIFGSNAVSANGLNFQISTLVNEDIPSNASTIELMIMMYFALAGFIFYFVYVNEAIALILAIMLPILMGIFVLNIPIAVNMIVSAIVIVGTCAIVIWKRGIYS